MRARDERLLLPGKVAVIGRGEADGVTRREELTEIQLRDRKASGRHARLSASAGGFLVEDLDSTNGTRINGERVDRAALGEGDVLEIGQTFFVCAALPPGFDAEATRDGHFGPTRTLTPALSRAPNSRELE